MPLVRKEPTFSSRFIRLTDGNIYKENYKFTNWREGQWTKAYISLTTTHGESLGEELYFARDYWQDRSRRKKMPKDWLNPPDQTVQQMFALSATGNSETLPVSANSVSVGFNLEKGLGLLTFVSVGKYALELNLPQTEVIAADYPNDDNPEADPILHASNKAVERFFKKILDYHLQEDYLTRLGLIYNPESGSCQMVYKSLGTLFRENLPLNMGFVGITKANLSNLKQVKVNTLAHLTLKVLETFPDILKN